MHSIMFYQPLSGVKFFFTPRSIAERNHRRPRMRPRVDLFPYGSQCYTHSHTHTFVGLTFYDILFMLAEAGSEKLIKKLKIYKKRTCCGNITLLATRYRYT